MFFFLPDTPGQRNAVNEKFPLHASFPSETPDETAEKIVQGAHARVREVYHPFWMVGPMSAFINFPFVRPVLEKVIQIAMRQGN